MLCQRTLVKSSYCNMSNMLIILLLKTKNYLEKRKQRTNVNGSYSNFDEIFSGVPQDSILDPLLFNIHICDLLFGIGDLDIASYADDNTPYAFSSELDLSLKNLRSYIIKIFEWLHNNRLKSNAGKCNLITSSTSPVEIKIENTSVKRVEPLGVHIDGRLDFDYHVSQICKKASKKIHVLSSVTKYMDQNRMLMKAFIISQFSYCSLVWMFHSRNTENRVNKVHERALRLVYDDSFDDSYDDRLRFDELLIIDKRSALTETVAQKCSIKKVLLEFSQNSQENTCARVWFLIKLQA